MRSAPPQGVVCPDIRADGEIGPWLRSHDDLWEARRASDMPIATAHRPAIARTSKSPTFLPYSTVPVTQPPAVSLNLGRTKGVVTRMSKTTTGMQSRKVDRTTVSSLFGPTLWH